MKGAGWGKQKTQVERAIGEGAQAEGERTLWQRACVGEKGAFTRLN